METTNKRTIKKLKIWKQQKYTLNVYHGNVNNRKIKSLFSRADFSLICKMTQHFLMFNVTCSFIRCYWQNLKDKQNVRMFWFLKKLCMSNVHTFSKIQPLPNFVLQK